MASLLPLTPFELNLEWQELGANFLRSIIEPNSDNRISHDDCKINFSQLVADGRFQMVERPCYYIYRQSTASGQFLGIWGQYLGEALGHENTLSEKLAAHCSYRAEVALECSPVILFHRPYPQLQLLLEGWSMDAPDVVVHRDNDRYELWRIDDPAETKIIGELVRQIGPCFIADGHHRLAAANGGPVSALLFSSDQLRVQGYHRLVSGDVDFKIDRLLWTLEKNWHRELLPHTEIYVPDRRCRLGMYLEGRWYQLDLRDGNARAASDAHLLQETILSPGLGLDDDRSPGLAYFPDGELTLLSKELSRPRSIAFTLYPASVAEILGMAEAGMMFPPKSTWIEPRAPHGIIVNHLGCGKSEKPEIVRPIR